MVFDEAAGAVQTIDFWDLELIRCAYGVKRAAYRFRSLLRTVAADAAVRIVGIADLLHAVAGKARRHRVNSPHNFVLRGVSCNERTRHNLLIDHVTKKAGLTFSVVGAESVVRKGRFQ